MKRTLAIILSILMIGAASLIISMGVKNVE